MLRRFSPGPRALRLGGDFEVALVVVFFQRLGFRFSDHCGAPRNPECRSVESRDRGKSYSPRRAPTDRTRWSLPGAPFGTAARVRAQVELNPASLRPRRIVGLERIEPRRRNYRC